MAKKILLWFGTNYTHFCLSYYLKKKLDCEAYAITDVTERPKLFLKNQKLVDFKQIWFFHDHIAQKNNMPDLNYLAKFEKKYKLDLWKLVQNERIFLYYNYHKYSKNEILSILEQECRLFEDILETDTFKFLVQNNYILRSWSFYSLIFVLPGSDILKERE